MERFWLLHPPHHQTGGLLPKPAHTHLDAHEHRVPWGVPTPSSGGLTLWLPSAHTEQVTAPREHPSGSEGPGC